MTNVLIIGANGRIARHVVEALQDIDDIQPTLLVRNAASLKDVNTAGMRIIEGDASNDDTLSAAVSGQNIVYANVSGEMDVLAEKIVRAMQKTKVSRLIFVTSLGIYNELPGKFGEWTDSKIGAYLPPYRRAADLIEASDLDYTVLRPAWLTDADEVDYETTERNETFKGTEVSRKSVADYIVRILKDPTLASKGNIGLDKPGTDGDMPPTRGPLLD